MRGFRRGGEVRRESRGVPWSCSVVVTWGDGGVYPGCNVSFYFVGDFCKIHIRLDEEVCTKDDLVDGSVWHDRVTFR